MHPHAATSSSSGLAPAAIVVVVAGVAAGMPLQVNVLKSNSRSFRVEIALQMQSKGGPPASYESFCVLFLLLQFVQIFFFYFVQAKIFVGCRSCCNSSSSEAATATLAATAAC